MAINFLKNQKWVITCYIDAFAGSGSRIDPKSKKETDGSALRILNLPVSFNRYYFKI